MAKGSLAQKRMIIKWGVYRWRIILGSIFYISPLWGVWGRYRFQYR